MSDMNKLTAGLSAIVGKDNVVTDTAVMAEYVARYHGFEQHELPVAIVYAVTAEEVKSVIDYVRDKLDCCIIPCSSDSSIKLSASSLPALGQRAVILNLSWMNKVFRVDVKNRVAFVEAGVTFAQLEQALKGTGLKMDYPLLARPDQSVIATMLDRDPITAPLNVWDINDPLLCLEVVFGNGKVFRTGSAAGPGTLEEQWAAGVAMNNSLGPAHTDFARVLSGSQGTLGVVTWASLKLELELSVEKILYAQADTVEKLAPIAWRGIRRRLGNNYIIANGFALGNMLGHSKEEIDKIAAANEGWTIAVNMAGKRIRPEQKVEYQSNDLCEMARAHPIRTKMTENIPSVDNLRMKKVLTGLNEGLLWKHRYAGNALDVFFLTTLDKADRYVEIAKDAVGDFGKLAIYIQPGMQGRYCQVELIVPYAEADKEKALVCY